MKLYCIGGYIKGRFTSIQYTLGHSMGGHCTKPPLFDALDWYHRRLIQQHNHCVVKECSYTSHSVDSIFQLFSSIGPVKFINIFLASQLSDASIPPIRYVSLKCLLPMLPVRSCVHSQHNSCNLISLGRVMLSSKAYQNSTAPVHCPCNNRKLSTQTLLPPH